MGFGEESNQQKVLVIEDELVTRELLRQTLEHEGYQPCLVETAEEALEKLPQETFLGVISDVHLAGMNGIELLRHLKRNDPERFVILVTGQGSLKGAVEAIQCGAFDYLSKPFSPFEISRLLQRAKLERESKRNLLKTRTEEKHHFASAVNSPRVSMGQAATTRSDETGVAGPFLRIGNDKTIESKGGTSEHFGLERGGVTKGDSVATRREFQESPPIDSKTLLGKSPKMVSVYKALAKASLSGSNVLIIGESGTGKELVAHAIHANSSRALKPFVTVNCGALTETLLESELFGHLKGSFTGAVANKRGLFDEADGGTIFLDEIGDISPALQVKLLRVIQEGEFKPVGSPESRRVDTRVIAATHRNLETMVKEGKFREDLFYRLKVITLQLPPLRERLEDIPMLARYFLKKQRTKNHRSEMCFSPEALALLQSYPWPGNIRELEHAVERACAMSNTSVLYPEDFPPELMKYDFTEALTLSTTPVTSFDEMKSLEAMEKRHIMRILQEVNFNKSKAADVLGIDRATLYRKAARYGIRLIEEKMI